MLSFMDNYPKRRSLFGILLLGGLSINSAFSANEIESNGVSTPPTVVISTVPDSPVKKAQFSLQGKTVSRLVVLKKRHENAPNDPVLAAHLAAEYIQLARKTSIATYYRLANKVIKPWARQAVIPGLPKKEVPQAILLIRATLSQHDHHYADASEDLYSLIKQQPRHVQAWLTLSTIQLVQGDYQKAQVSCSALARISSHWLASLCYSQLYSLTGSAKRAYKMQQQLVSQLHDQQKALRLWVTGLLAETALRLGRHQQAEQYFKAGLAIKGNDTYLLRTYSDYLLHQQRPKEVIQLLTTQPEEDQLLLRVAIATKQLGDSVVMKRLVTLLEQRFANAFAKNNHTHGREEALFLLEFKMKDKASKQRALKLAKKNWDSQKEPDDALIFLRAIRANQLIDQQKILIQWMKQHKLQDQRLTALLNK